MYRPGTRTVYSPACQTPQRTELPEHGRPVTTVHVNVNAVAPHKGYSSASRLAAKIAHGTRQLSLIVFAFAATASPTALPSRFPGAHVAASTYRRVVAHLQPRTCPRDSELPRSCSDIRQSAGACTVCCWCIAGIASSLQCLEWSSRTWTMQLIERRSGAIAS